MLMGWLAGSVGQSLLPELAHNLAWYRRLSQTLAVLTQSGIVIGTADFAPGGFHSGLSQARVTSALRALPPTPLVYLNDKAETQHMNWH